MKSHHRRILVAVVVAVAAALAYHGAAAGLVPNDLTTVGLTPTDLANLLVGSGVTITNVTYKGSLRAAGKFTGGSAAIGFESGIVLSTGRMKDVVGPNNSLTTGTNLAAGTPPQPGGCFNSADGTFTRGLPGDADLNALSGFTTCDATVMEIDFIPNRDKVFLQYVFGSEEYNEFVNKQFNDSFGFFVNGVNCATVDPAHQVPVSINTINNGGPLRLGQPPVSHPELYINNDFHPIAPLDTQMDGLTIVLTCQASVSPNITNHIKLAIADASDPVLDSNVFLQARSFTTTAPLTIVKMTEGTDNDFAPGPFILIRPGINAPVTWTYKVTNTGSLPFTSVAVTDDREGPICTIGTLAAGASASCTKSNTAAEGQYSNIGTVTGISSLIGPVTDHNPDNYFGARPGIAIVKRTNDTDNDSAPGPTVLVGSPVTWSYEVTNTGNVTLTGVSVSDSDASLVVSCPTTTLPPGVAMMCLANAPAKAGQYVNTGTVTATAPVGPPVTASNVDHYFGADPKIAIVKKTNATDNNLPPGRLVRVGDPVLWTYEVTNTGNVDLTGVAVTDNRGVAVNCPAVTLAVGNSFVCTANSVAVRGQYDNTGTASAKFGPVSVNGKIDTVTVTAKDDDHYFGADPAIAIVKKTNGTDNDVAPGPFVLTGNPVTWTYELTNTGNVMLTNVSVTDDRGVQVSCPSTTLAAGASVSCTASGTAIKGQYENTGTASGQVEVVTTAGATKTLTANATNIDHYFGADPRVSIVKKTNENDNTAAPGRLIRVGDPVIWTYAVANTGNVDLTDLAVIDSRGVAVNCPSASLAVGASFVCTANGIAVKGQYDNTGTASAKFGPVSVNGRIDTVTVTASDDDHYFGADPAIAIVKKTNGKDSDAAPGPFVLAGDPVTWTYELTNTGNVTLMNVGVTDDRGVPVTCPVTTLGTGKSVTCSASGNAVKGQYENTGTASGQIEVVTTTGTTKTLTVNASNPDHYFGIDPRITLVKLTNGTNNDSAPGPFVLVGKPVTWTYLVTNTGNVALPNVTVTDDRGVVVNCPATTLAVGASVTCTASGVAVKGQYENTGTATANIDALSNTGQTKTVTVTARDIDHYFGADPNIAIVKKTFDTDNNLPPGAIKLVGTPVQWTYSVTNIGNVPLVGVAVTDDKEGPVCTIPLLAVGQTAPACAKSGIVALGQYENTSFVSGKFGPVDVGGKIDTVTVTATDPDHYFGGRPAISIVKQTNGTDNDAPPGPAILADKPVTWTYRVSNTGNLPLANVAVTDDKIGVVTCPATTLLPGESILCSATSKAVEGQYENIGTATGSSVLGPVAARNPDHYFGVNSGTFFVIGDVEAHKVGDVVNFWGAQWWKNNQMSGLVTPGEPAFKGYALNVDVSSATGCGGTWSTRPGNSPPPPDAIPQFVAIIVTDTVVKDGPVLSGSIKELVVVHQDGGYSPNPGHRGDGPVFAVICKE